MSKANAKNALSRLMGTIYSHYARQVEEYFGKLESDLAEAKKTEEQAVRMLGAAGLEMADMIKERDHYQAAYKAENDRKLEDETRLRKVSEENLRLAKHGQRLQAAYDSLRKENEELGQEISELKNAKPAPVVLPGHIAEALGKTLKLHAGRKDFVAWVIAGEIQSNDSRELRLLKNHAQRKDAFIPLVNAIQHGYTTTEPEPTPEVKFAAAVQEVLNAGYSTVQTAVKINELSKAYEQDKQAK
ncbi:hypothetical protein [Paenibacillus sp. MMO-58]|uniref:hypothetical protein n=1 Tax=Paenibacillus sp. MMO-58 TaxID=3081290 RepID=UPI003017B257